MELSPALLAEKMLRPLEFMAVGQRIGREAATVAETSPPPDRVELPGTPGSGSAGIVRENLTGLKASKRLGMVRAGQRPLPVFGQYDVVVVGGGTSGAPAGISAARRGSRTLVIEYLDFAPNAQEQQVLSKIPVVGIDAECGLPRSTYAPVLDLWQVNEVFNAKASLIASYSRDGIRANVYGLVAQSFPLKA